MTYQVIYLSKMHGRWLSYGGAVMALYSLLIADHLLLVLSVGLIILGILWHNQELLTQVEERVGKARSRPKKGFTRWRLLALSDLSRRKDAD